MLRRTREKALPFVPGVIGWWFGTTNTTYACIALPSFFLPYQPYHSTNHMVWYHTILTTIASLSNFLFLIATKLVVDFEKNATKSSVGEKVHEGTQPS